VEFIANIKLETPRRPALLTARRSLRFAPARAKGMLHRRLSHPASLRRAFLHRLSLSISSVLIWPTPAVPGNAKKIVEVEMAEGHAPAPHIGDTVGDPFGTLLQPSSSSPRRLLAESSLSR
jgi:hypothetical protein